MADETTGTRNQDPSLFCHKLSFLPCEKNDLVLEVNLSWRAAEKQTGRNAAQAVGCERFRRLMCEAFCPSAPLVTEEMEATPLNVGRYLCLHGSTDQIR